MKNPEAIVYALFSVLLGFMLALQLEAWGVELLLPKPWPEVPEWRAALSGAGTFMAWSAIIRGVYRLATKKPE